MSKKITFSKDARNKLLSGVNQLANAVTATLGPSGRNVIIEKDMGNPVSTKDGVTVAKSIELKDKVENLGAQIVKQAAIKTADYAGDGTTTSTLLAQEILKEGIARMEAGSNAVDIKKGIDNATEKVTEFLSSISKDITDEVQLEQIATISANNDKEVGKLISTAMDKVGRDGVVTIEESKTGETYLETVEGMQFDRGYKSPYFVTDNNSMTSVLKDPFILIVDKRLNQVKELLPILEAVSQQNKSLLIIAEDIDGEALSTMVVNKMRGILACAAVKAPDFGDRRKAIMEDIAELTGGQVVSSEKGMRLEKFDTEWLGKANKATISKESTTIIDAQGSEESINQRIAYLKDLIEESQSPFEKENLQNRLAKFIGGVAVVNVGGHTEIEMKEKKDRVEDALHATKAALEEGVLPGGGVALLNAANDLVHSLDKVDNRDERTGYDIVINAIEQPFFKILTNAGLSDTYITNIETNIKQTGDVWEGFNPRADKSVNMFNEGIIDPTKVTRLALENAASVAGTLLITEAVVSKGKEKENKPVGGVDPNMLLG
jgi:chaperonin GroEL|tara:strand:+ start:2133 stop:3776 length:1644 start_codon:yes stop_codon:yes gene_type:complete